MSVLASTWAWQQQIPPNWKLVLVALADHAHDDGAGAYPSKALLAAKTGYGERQVQRILGQMVGGGVIRIVRRSTTTRPTEYTLSMQDLFTVRRDKWGDNLTPPEAVSDVSPGESSEALEGVSDVSLTIKEPSEEPSTTPAPADAETAEDPNASHLVAAWFDGAKDREGETGEKPFPTIIKRMKGQAKNMAKDLSTQQDWDRAVVAAYNAGCQGLWDLAQGVPVARKSKFVSEKALEEAKIFGPGVAAAEARMAERDAKILAEREAQGS